MGLLRPLGWAQTKNISHGQPYPWVSKPPPLIWKSVILDFPVSLVGWEDTLLRWYYRDWKWCNWIWRLLLRSKYWVNVKIYSEKFQNHFLEMPFYEIQIKSNHKLPSNLVSLSLKLEQIRPEHYGEMSTIYGKLVTKAWENYSTILEQNSPDLGASSSWKFENNGMVFT